MQAPLLARGGRRRVTAAVALLLATLAGSSAASAQTTLSVSPDVVVETTTALTFPVPATFDLGAAVPGVTGNYTASRDVRADSTNGCGASLVVSDPSSFAPGRLVHDRSTPLQALPQPVQARAYPIPGGPSAFAAVTATPTLLLTFVGPFSNVTVRIDVRQGINAADEVRAGAYRKPLTFALVSGCGSPPDTQITSGPADSEVTNRPLFQFSSGVLGATFKCRIDGPGGAFGTFTPCVSGSEPPLTGDGEYRFLVRAMDGNGESDPIPATRRFVLDRTAPVATITTGPTGPIATTAASFGFVSTDDGARFECRLDGPGLALGPYGGCTAPFSLDGLGDGSYALAVRTIDAVGNASEPATRSFTVDTVAPDTVIGAGPASPSFAFTSTEPGSTFECSLRPAPYEPCASPRTYAGLANGTYTFSVRARDAAGNVDASPAAREFKVGGCPVNATPDRNDVDHDGFACEVLPLGTVPLIAGVRTRVKLISGKVFVKLATPHRGPRQAARFVPLQGVATVPLGSTIDARHGVMEATSAANGFAQGKQAEKQTVQVRAGVARIEQKERARGAKPSKTIPVTLKLVTPSDAKARCGPLKPKREVRRVTIKAKGNYSVVAGASIVTAKKATFTVIDRCDGTRAVVDRGSAGIKPKGGGKSQRVRQGHEHFEKAKLFRATKQTSKRS